MCTRHDLDFYQGFAGDKCAYCLDPHKAGVIPCRAEGHIVKVCFGCHQRIRIRRLLDNYHLFEPLECTVEVVA